MFDINITEILISSVVLFIVGFITTKLWGVDIPKILSDLVVILVLTIPMMLYNPHSTIEQMVNFLTNYIMTFINIFIPAAIGDAIGTILSEITNPRR